MNATSHIDFHTVINYTSYITSTYNYTLCIDYFIIIPIDETHLVVVRELIYQELSPKCVNAENSTERRSYNRQVNRSPQL